MARDNRLDRGMVVAAAALTLGKAGDAAVLAKAHAYRAFVHAHPGLYVATLQPVAPDDTQMQALAHEMLEVTLAVLSAYGLRDEDALHAVRGLRSITHGFVTLEASGMFQMGIDLDESFERLVRTFIAGLHTATGNEETRVGSSKLKTQNSKLTEVTQ